MFLEPSICECTRSYLVLLAYLARVDDETATKVGAVAFVSYTERDQENTLVRHVISG